MFPYHGTAAEHLRARSIDLLPKAATLVGIDEQTALVRLPNGSWTVRGAGSVSVYEADTSMAYLAGATVPGLPV